MRCRVVIAVMCLGAGLQTSALFLGSTQRKPTSRCLVGVTGRTPAERCLALRASVTEIRHVSLLQVGTHPTDPACEEPDNVKKAADGIFPVIHCCVTARLKVAELEEKTVYCDEKDICWKTLETILPKALEYYKAQEKALCVTTTTTTTTTSTSTSTKNMDARTESRRSSNQTTVSSNSSNSSNRADDNSTDTNSSASHVDDGPFEPNWCVQECVQEDVKHDLCEKFCSYLHEEVANKFEKKMKSRAVNIESEVDERVKARAKNNSCA